MLYKIRVVDSGDKNFDIRNPDKDIAEITIETDDSTILDSLSQYLRKMYPDRQYVSICSYIECMTSKNYTKH